MAFNPVNSGCFFDDESSLDLPSDGQAATSVNVVNSTTVTGVTPAHAAGVVDVVIATPAGGATLVNGYTYVTTVVGQPSVQNDGVSGFS